MSRRVTMMYPTPRPQLAPTQTVDKLKHSDTNGGNQNNGSRMLRIITAFVFSNLCNFRPGWEKYSYAMTIIDFNACSDQHFCSYLLESPLTTMIKHVWSPEDVEITVAGIVAILPTAKMKLIEARQRMMSWMVVKFLWSMNQAGKMFWRFGILSIVKWMSWLSCFEVDQNELESTLEFSLHVDCQYCCGASLCTMSKR